jgi:uncharacterized integral membrane protein
MSSLVSRLVLPGSLALLTLASGFWLSNSGKPYSTLIFTIHKLIALAAIIATAVTINHLHKTTELGLAVEITAIVITGLLFLCLLVSGALMSILKQEPAVIRTIHHVAPYLAVISSAVTFYLLASGK